MRVVPVALLLFAVLFVVTFTILPPYMREDSQGAIALLRPLGAMTMVLAILLLCITMKASRFDKAFALYVLSFGSFLVLLTITGARQGLFLDLPDAANTFLHVLLVVLPFTIASTITAPYRDGPSKRLWS